MIDDALLDIVIELRKKIDKHHIILISNDNNDPVELCDLTESPARCHCGTNCNDKPVGKKHSLANNTEAYICQKHIHEQNYYMP